jgi:hypothetical protein
MEPPGNPGRFSGKVGLVLRKTGCFPVETSSVVSGKAVERRWKIVGRRWKRALSHVEKWTPPVDVVCTGCG